MSSNQYIHIGELRRNHSIIKRFTDWQRWKLRLPLFALIVVYPLYKFFSSGEEFISTFGHGDLLLFSALVLIELSIEAAYINAESQQVMTNSIDSLIENSRFFGIVLVFVYGAMKLMINRENQLNQMPKSKATAFCVFSLSVTFLVVCFCFFAFWKALANVIGREDLK